MLHEVPHARRRPAQGSARSCSGGASRSFGWSTSVGAHCGVRAAAEPGDAGAGQLTWRGLEMTGLDPPDRVHDDRPAAVQVFGCQQPLAIFLEARRAADAEDVLPHAAPDPILRVPEGEEAWLESERLSFLVDAVLAGQVVERELDVVQLGTEICLVGVLHRLARARLVVDDLHLAIADVVDSVDLAYDLRTVKLEAEPNLGVDGAEPSNELHAGDEPDVVAQQRADLALFALAVQHALHVYEIALEVALERGFEPFLLMLGVERSPFTFLGVEVLEHLVQEPSALHGHRTRLLDQARVVVVPIE